MMVWIGLDLPCVSEEQAGETIAAVMESRLVKDFVCHSMISRNFGILASSF